MEHSHKCIKCGVEYKDNEIDAYYCESCNEQKKVIAKQVDDKLKGNVNYNTKSELQIYDEMAKVKGTRFVNIKDLGISL